VASITSFYGFANTGIDFRTHERYGIPSLFRDNTRIEEPGYATDLFCREALNFIRANRPRPFFFYLAFNAPHGASNLDPEERVAQAPPESLAVYADIAAQVALRFLGGSCGLYAIVAGAPNCPGVMPMRRWKCGKNWLWLENPAQVATSARDRLVRACRTSRARSTRRTRTYWWGDNPVAVLSCGAKWVCCNRHSRRIVHAPRQQQDSSQCQAGEVS
jgi:hypothetical protein